MPLPQSITTTSSVGYYRLFKAIPRSYYWLLLATLNYSRLRTLRSWREWKIGYARGVPGHTHPYLVRRRSRKMRKPAVPKDGPTKGPELAQTWRPQSVQDELPQIGSIEFSLLALAPSAGLFGDHLGAILGPPWDHCGAILEPCDYRTQVQFTCSSSTHSLSLRAV